jgi:AcrR family transcriptional regulator
VTTVEGRPLGRPRNTAADEAVATAVLDCLVEDGYEGMTIDRVAARAGVGRATIYRRWPSKADMVIDAVRRRTFTSFEAPDTGTLRGDLEQLYAAVQACMSAEHGILQRLHLEQARHPELATALRSTVIAERRAVVERVLHRGVARGELPADTDIELLAAVGPAVIWQQLTLLGRDPDPDLPRRLADLLVSTRSA